MNKEIKKYIKYVKKIIPFYSKDKKEFLKLLTQKIIEFSNEHDSCSYQDIVDEFGSPNEVAGSYIESLENDDIIKQLNKKYIFKIYKGTDRSYNQTDVLPVVFSDEFDNLLSSSYSYEKAEYRNTALIGGEGEGINKRTTTIGDTAGMKRYETYIDGSSVSSNGKIITEEEYYKMLQNYGKEQLSTVAFTEKFEGNVDPAGNYVLNKDYFLGDIVQVINAYGIRATPRIIEIIESEDENGASTVPTFSTWEV